MLFLKLWETYQEVKSFIFRFDGSKMMLWIENGYEVLLRDACTTSKLSTKVTYILLKTYVSRKKLERNVSLKRKRNVS